jgi:hypothetical protein
MLPLKTVSSFSVEWSLTLFVMEQNCYSEQSQNVGKIFTPKILKALDISLSLLPQRM